MEEKLSGRSGAIAIGLILEVCSGEARAGELDPIAGSWVAEGVSCTALYDFSDDRTLKIGGDKIEFFEGTCAIRQSSISGAIFDLNVICESEERLPHEFWWIACSGEVQKFTAGDDDTDALMSSGRSRFLHHQLGSKIYVRGSLTWGHRDLPQPCKGSN